MHMKDNSLDDVEGRLKDLDLLGVDIQVIYPTVFVFVADVEDKDLAAAICRAHNNYVADRCRKAPDRLKGVAIGQSVALIITMSPTDAGRHLTD
jgi:predicted TIM-barrel fold metal-dependent hydrolase